jgi:hypothetical protein
VHAALGSFCDCIPLVAEACGLDVLGPPQPWNEAVSNGKFCSPGCEILLKGSEDGACAASFAGALRDNYDFLCGCGVDLTAACGSLTGPGPFSDRCCQSALGDSCFMDDPVEVRETLVIALSSRPSRLALHFRPPLLFYPLRSAREGGFLERPAIRLFPDPVKPPCD